VLITWLALPNPSTLIATPRADTCPTFRTSPQTACHPSAITPSLHDTRSLSTDPVLTASTADTRPSISTTPNANNFASESWRPCRHPLSRHWSCVAHRTVLKTPPSRAIPSAGRKPPATPDACVLLRKPREKPSGIPIRAIGPNPQPSNGQACGPGGAGLPQRPSVTRHAGVPGRAGVNRPEDAGLCSKSS